MDRAAEAQLALIVAGIKTQHPHLTDQKKKEPQCAIWMAIIVFTAKRHKRTPTE